MGEGFPLWSTVSMAAEGRKPLRDWISLSVSLCFYAPRFCVSPFLKFPEILTIEGDIKLLFVISSGLPTIKDHEHVTDLQMLSLLPSNALSKMT
ncbi:hypothetical protein ZWY2020_016857 [Hordeum vulgare]|nr:hypothetical protein ZWY2020_016857 [Hordeum vulgare]